MRHPLIRCLFASSAFLLSPSRAADHDLLIRDALIVDGSGAPAKKGSVAVSGGRITAVGEVSGDASTVIDAKGQVIAPGFIDVHTHSERIARIPSVENFVRMGVTTIVTGNCGSSTTTVAEFFRTLESVRVTINVATLIGHNSVRQRAMGGNFNRPPTAEELETMKSLVSTAMNEGAVGLSTGLIYLPGTFAKTDEIVELAKIAAASNGIYASHMRAETTKIFEALEEVFRVAREAKIPAEISHLKLSGPTAWGKAKEVIARIDQARSEGLRITHDAYAYAASSTGLAQLIPDEAREGTREDYIARIGNPEKKAAIIAEMEKTRARQGRKDYSYVAIASFEADPRLNGMRVPAAAKLKRGSDSLADQVELILQIAAEGGASAVYHSMNEEDLEEFLRDTRTMIASDGGPRVFGEAVPHPRSYGNNARMLARYVREKKLLSLEEAIRRMTSLPAETFRLADRGLIKAGYIADLVVFDPSTVNDPSTFEDPHRFAEGFSTVIVNGRPVLLDGKLTEERPGKPVRLTK